MRLVDANLLVYARVVRFAQLGAAKAWLDARLNARASDGSSDGLRWEDPLRKG